MVHRASRRVPRGLRAWDSTARTAEPRRGNDCLEQLWLLPWKEHEGGIMRMGAHEEKFPAARRVGKIAGKVLARFGIGSFRGYPLLFVPVYPNVGAVPAGLLGIGIDSFLLCNTFVWRQHLKGRRWATSVLQHEVAHLKDFAEHPWQLLPLVLGRVGARHFPHVRVLLYAFYLYVEAKANVRALDDGASPLILAFSYFTYVRAFRKSIRLLQ